MNKRNRKAAANTRLIANKLHEITRSLETFDRADLEAIDADLVSLTETNCWFVEYELRDAMRRIIGRVLLEKARERRRAVEHLGTEK